MSAQMFIDGFPNITNIDLSEVRAAKMHFLSEKCIFAPNAILSQRNIPI